MAISREQIILCYKLLLEREPESEDVIQQKISCNTLAELVTEFIRSSEFHEKHPDVYSRINARVLYETKYGFRIWGNLLDLSIFTQIILNNYELDCVEFVRRHVSQGAKAIDIGANIGFFSLLLSKLVGSDGQVISFEPMPFLFDLAQKSLEENKFYNCSLHNVALSDSVGTGQLVFAPDSSNWGGAFLSSHEILPDHSVLTVTTAPLIQYTDSFNADFIKIDAEGAEYTILKSCIDYLAKAKPTIMSEIHAEQLMRVSKCTAYDYIKLLSSIGYECRYILSGGDIGDIVTSDSIPPVTNVAFVHKKN